MLKFKQFKRFELTRRLSLILFKIKTMKISIFKITVVKSNKRSIDVDGCTDCLLLIFLTLLIVALCQVVPFNGGHRRRMQLAFGAKNAFALYTRATEENRSSTKERQL